MADLIYKQDILGGIEVGTDPLDMNADRSVDCSNIRIDKPGQITNDVGIEKQLTTAYASDIVAVIQLGDSATLVEVT
jgi:hypothetical protein